MGLFDFPGVYIYIRLAVIFQVDIQKKKFLLAYQKSAVVALNSVVVKGQLISKAIYGLVTSPKKRADEFVSFAF